jgi:hypothetical protein
MAVHSASFLPAQADASEPLDASKLRDRLDPQKIEILSFPLIVSGNYQARNEAKIVASSG